MTLVTATLQAECGFALRHRCWRPAAGHQIGRDKGHNLRNARRATKEKLQNGGKARGERLGWATEAL